MKSPADRVIELYRSHARAWVARRGRHLTEKVWIDRFLQRLPDAPSVLDLGCGSGEPIGRYLLETGSEVVGVDGSQELIEIAQGRVPGATWITADMRALRLDMAFDGILAWNSTFHLTPEDQRGMFAVFERHAAPGAALIFTSGPRYGDALGEFEGEALYHSSLDEDEYRALLKQHGFAVVDHVVEDPDCGFLTVWLAQKDASFPLERP
ncbi:class I SAM-dependent DNA methyltransferase [Aestuariibius sp. 2305UL40-4]|uniref:class I SAM-dependent DNA methyltransferase n=1 Tax=Aestuariibius violaceus TaxID=3234132 RepID=UPI00345EA82E